MNLCEMAAEQESWFREEAKHLNSEVGLAVLEALDAPNRRYVWLALDNVAKKFGLPPEWTDRITEYYSAVF